MFLKNFTAFLSTTATVAAVAVAAPAGEEEFRTRDSSEMYDYIIVGGGTAGVALATRLSQYLPESSILLLEAGSAAPDEIRINAPGMRGSTLFSEYDWNFTSIPQQTLGGRSVDVNRGHVLGGSSAINYLCYDRAAAGEYDTLGELAWDTNTWNWDTMLSAMMKAENYTDDPSLVDPDVHGDDGPIRNRFNRIVPGQFETWVPTLNSLGIPHNEESLGGNNIGVMFQGTNIDDRHWNRSYSANSYLPQAGENLIVKTNSHVVKINFEDETAIPLKAVGVTLDDGTIFTANKEVVLSAGSIGSPQLLELSGIGQSNVLQAAGIAPLLNLPGVGENYQDHIRLSSAFQMKENYSTFDPFIYDAGSEFVAEQVGLWIQGEESWLDYTTTPYSFVNWGLILKPLEEFDLLRLAWKGADKTSPIDWAKLKWLLDSKIPQVEFIMEANYVGIGTYPGGPILTIFASLMHPMSRGSTHISPANPTDKPVIDVNYYDNPYDLQAMLEAAKMTRKIANTEPMRSTWLNEYEPGPDVDTDEEWIEFIKDATLSFFHPVGTCSMLPKWQGGVVNSELKVYGTEGLRIVDASVMAVLISAHIQTAVYAIAEIGATMIANEA